MIRSAWSKTAHRCKPGLSLTSEYLPWANEHSVCGTVCEVLDDTAILPTRTKAKDYLNLHEPLWENSSANQAISKIEEESHWLVSIQNWPASFATYQQKPPPLRAGLYKPMKRPAFIRLT